MDEHCQPAVAQGGERVRDHRGLVRLLGVCTHDLAIEPKQPPVVVVEHPAVRAHGGPIAFEPDVRDRLPRGDAGVVADVVVAWDSVHGGRHSGERGGGERQVLAMVGAIEADVATGDDQIGTDRVERRDDAVEVGAEQLGARTEVRV